MLCTIDVGLLLSLEKVILSAASAHQLISFKVFPESFQGVSGSDLSDYCECLHCHLNSVTLVF